MELYRISRAPYIRDLTGEGARSHGGRWNKKGIPVVYTSEHISLAAMEVLVNVTSTDLPGDLQLATLYIPDNASSEIIRLEDLPKNWREYPAPDSIMEVGTQWAEKGESLLIRVPSAVIPRERNILINPMHREFSRVKIVNVEEFSFDERFK